MQKIGLSRTCKNGSHTTLTSCFICNFCNKTKKDSLNRRHWKSHLSSVFWNICFGHLLVCVTLQDLLKGHLGRRSGESGRSDAEETNRFRRDERTKKSERIPWLVTCHQSSLAKLQVSECSTRVNWSSSTGIRLDTLTPRHLESETAEPPCGFDALGDLLWHLPAAGSSGILGIPGSPHLRQFVKSLPEGKPIKKIIQTYTNMRKTGYEEVQSYEVLRSYG